MGELDGLRALVVDQVHPIAIQILSARLSVTHLPHIPSCEELATLLPHYDALLMRVAPRITREMLLSPGRLRVISVASAGVDHIDLAATAAAGVRVYNQPGVNRDSVAEFTFGLLISLMRSIPMAIESLRQGNWERNRFQQGLELSGRTIGIIGFGNAGTRVAEIAQGFHMKVLSYSPFTTDQKAQAYGAKLATLNEILEEADVVSLHCPLTPQTHHLIGENELARMREGAFLLNLSRGGVVDEQALYEALSSGHLAGAAADVFEREPPGLIPLAQLPNFLGTPHIAGPTIDSLWRSGARAAELILDHLGYSLPEFCLAAISRD